MDINMNNVKFFKKLGDNWVYLAQSEEDEEGIKVFYDDGTYGNNSEAGKKIEDFYSEYVKMLGEINGIRALDNLGQVMDFATTLAQTYGDKLEPMVNSTTPGMSAQYYKNYIYSKLDKLLLVKNINPFVNTEGAVKVSN